jgi:hypothetical protein
MKLLHSLFKTLLVLVFLSTSFSATAEESFRINDYTVKISRYDLDTPRSSWPSGRRTLDPRLAQPTSLDGAVISGIGTTRIRDKDIRVTFKNIELKKLVKRRFPGARPATATPQLLAIRGTVQATSRNSRYTYSLGSHRIRVTTKTLRIEPKKATAKVRVNADFSHFTNRSSPVVLKSRKAQISSNGSVAGSDFKGAVLLRLKSTPFSLHVSSTDLYRVNLGKAFSTTAFGGRGIHIRGIASKDNVKAFSASGIVEENRNVRLQLRLTQPFYSRPEDYILQVKSGTATVAYTASGLSALSGSFLSDVTMPSPIRNRNNQPLAKLTDVELKIDNKSSLD